MSQEKLRVTEEIDAEKPSRVFWCDAWQRYRRRPIGMLALGFVLFFSFLFQNTFETLTILGLIYLLSIPFSYVHFLRLRKKHGK